LCTIGRICNRCTGFVAMTTAPNAKCQQVLVLALRLVYFSFWLNLVLFPQRWQQDQFLGAILLACHSRRLPHQPSFSMPQAPEPHYHPIKPSVFWSQAAGHSVIILAIRVNMRSFILYHIYTNGSNISSSDKTQHTPQRYNINNLPGKLTQSISS